MFENSKKKREREILNKIRPVKLGELLETKSKSF